MPWQSTTAPSLSEKIASVNLESCSLKQETYRGLPDTATVLG